MLAGVGHLAYGAAVTVNNSAGQPLENSGPPQDADVIDADDVALSIETHQHAVDYDGDGDLDLVVGCSSRKFFYYENTATDGKVELSKKARELSVTSPYFPTSPHLVDWDHDGDLDLLSGTYKGGAIISINTGTRRQPIWSRFRWLIKPTAPRTQVILEGREVRPARYSKVWATDWNRDGELDLLVGDCVCIVHPEEELTISEYRRRTFAWEMKRAHVLLKYRKLWNRYDAATVEAELSGRKIDSALDAAVKQANAELESVHNSLAEFQGIRWTGFVWLYLRKTHDGS